MPRKIAYGKISRHLKIGQQKVDLKVPFWTPKEQTSQIGRLKYYWKFHHFRSIFNKPFVLACHYYHAHDYKWRKLKLELATLGIKPAFVSPRIAREAVAGTLSEPLEMALGEKTILFYTKDTKDRIGADGEKLREVLRLILTTEKLFILAGRIDRAIYYEEDFFRGVLEREVLAKDELAQTLASLPQNIVPSLCSQHLSECVRALSWYVDYRRRGDQAKESKT